MTVGQSTATRMIPSALATTACWMPVSICVGSYFASKTWTFQPALPAACYAAATPRVE
ncbi:hypothetical protein [Amycolatopsis sp. cg13]|uniref:hypothetical protein n=1 Tax=Amycolatopsis sp. cg13 TaxID=3238807 RepID=UPI003526168B